ncbi:hypothetical protein BaRGS_00032590, partial [Batillaria attramentaria]
AIARLCLVIPPSRVPLISSQALESSSGVVTADHSFAAILKSISRAEELQVRWRKYTEDIVPLDAIVSDANKRSKDSDRKARLRKHP